LTAHKVRRYRTSKGRDRWEGQALDSSTDPPGLEGGDVISGHFRLIVVLMGVQRDVSLVIPAYNERENIPALIEASKKALSEFDGSHEIVLINDGSSDGSRELIDELAASEPLLRPIHHAQGQNIGCHPSELEGLKAARGDLMLFLPADLQIHPNVLPAFAEAAEHADVIASHRVQRADAAWRRHLSAANNRVERFLMGVSVHDAHSSMALTRRAVDQVVSDVMSRSAVIPAEILVRAKRAHLPIAEIPIEHHPRAAGRQTGAAPSEILKVQADLLKLRMRLWRQGTAAGASA
jgi:glycosyltransferase involved in cell wall biosynthesis